MSHATTRRIGRGAVSKSGAARGARSRAGARRNPRDIRFVSMAVLASLAVIGVLFLYIWCRLTVVSMGYDISRANMERSTLMEQNRRLKIEFMRLKSPERIERIAMTELGLVHPSEGQIIKVSR